MSSGYCQSNGRQELSKDCKMEEFIKDLLKLYILESFDFEKERNERLKIEKPEVG